MVTIKVWLILFFGTACWSAAIIGNNAHEVTRGFPACKLPDMTRISQAFMSMAQSMNELRVVTRTDRPNTPMKMVAAPLITFLESTQIVLRELIEVSELFGDVIISLEQASDALCAMVLSQGARKVNFELVGLFKNIKSRLQQECPGGKIITNPLSTIFANRCITFFFEALIDDISAIIAILEGEYWLDGELVFSPTI